MRKLWLMCVLLGGCIETSEECSKDTDCKGARVCNYGVCEEPTPSEEGGEEFISGGQVTRSYAATGALVAYQTKAFCTATLVAPDRVLTAAHCLQGMTAGSIEFVLGAELSSSTLRSGISAVYPHPNWNGNFQQGNDLAVLVLSQPITSVAPVNVYGGNVTTLQGQQMTLVGYGRQFNDQITGIRRLARVQIQSFSAQTIDYSYMGMGACNGDSGGPAYVEIGGTPRQIGVTSWGDQSCLADGHYQRLDIHYAWLMMHGVPMERATLDCEGGGCDGQCEEDPQCWDLLCPSGSCSSPSGRCVADGTCDNDCGLADPDCNQAVDYCQSYGLYGNGVCDYNCPSPDPDCTNTCTPVRWYYDQYQNLCFFLDPSNRVCSYYPPYCDYYYGCRCF